MNQFLRGFPILERGHYSLEEEIHPQSHFHLHHFPMTDGLKTGQDSTPHRSTSRSLSKTNMRSQRLRQHKHTMGLKVLVTLWGTGGGEIEKSARRAMWRPHISLACRCQESLSKHRRSLRKTFYVHLSTFLFFPKITKQQINQNFHVRAFSRYSKLFYTFSYFSFPKWLSLWVCLYQFQRDWFPLNYWAIARGRFLGWHGYNSPPPINNGILL